MDKNYEAESAVRTGDKVAQLEYGHAIVPGGTLDVFEPVWCDRVKAHTAETRRRDNHEKDQYSVSCPQKRD